MTTGPQFGEVWEGALGALESNHAGLEDLVRRLPPTVAVSGPELLHTLGLSHASPWRRYLLDRREQEAQIPVRRIVELHFLLEENRRARWNGSFFLALAKASLLLPHPWQEVRHGALRPSARRESDGPSIEGRKPSGWKSGWPCKWRPARHCGV